MAHRGGLRNISVMRCVLTGVVVNVTAVALAVPIDWNTPAGMNMPFNTFQWANGKSNDDNLGLTEGLWGQPTATATGFDFNNLRPEFAAIATGGGVGSRQSEMDVDVTAMGAAFTELHIVEKGTWTGSISAVNQSAASVEIFQFLAAPFVLNTINVPITFNMDGTWEARLDINDTTTFGGGDAGIFGTLSNFSLSIINTLAANPASGDASITKTSVTVDLPEPVSVGLLALGAIPIVMQRRRKVAHNE